MKGRACVLEKLLLCIMDRASQIDKVIYRDVSNDLMTYNCENYPKNPLFGVIDIIWGSVVRDSSVCMLKSLKGKNGWDGSEGQKGNFFTI